METFICKYCGKVCKNKNSLVQHEIRCKENPNKIDISKSINNLKIYLQKIINKEVVKKYKNGYDKA